MNLKNNSGFSDFSGGVWGVHIWGIYCFLKLGGADGGVLWEYVRNFGLYCLGAVASLSPTFPLAVMVK